MSDFQISEDEKTLIENFRAAGFIGPPDPVPVVQKMRKWIEHLADRANTVATLRRYAAGAASRDEAIAAAGVRDYAELLPLLGDLELTPPRPSEEQIEAEVGMFVSLFKGSRGQEGEE